MENSKPKKYLMRYIKFCCSTIETIINAILASFILINPINQFRFVYFSDYLFPLIDSRISLKIFQNRSIQFFKIYLIKCTGCSNKNGHWQYMGTFYPRQSGKKYQDYRDQVKSIINTKIDEICYWLHKISLNRT